MGLEGKSPQMSRQLELPLEGRGEAPRAQRSEEEPTATCGKERSGTSGLMELVCERQNLQAALKRVRKNKGSPGIDGMTVDELPEHLRAHWSELREQLLTAAYRPSMVKEQLIPKGNGEMRKLGIPTVLDRFIQQALLQVLQPIFDPSFSQHSHGFRPGRRAHDAIREARRLVQEGRRWVVDVDLEKFFDRVNHDVLMGRLDKRISDKTMLGLIRRYLNTGIMASGVVMERYEGTPQGGPLSPLLANVLLDEVDKELEKRGHAFVRYADDCNVYVRSEKAGLRVMGAMQKEFAKLRLRINEAKSAVDRPWNRRFLGFTFRRGREIRRRVSPRAVEKAKDRIRELTNRNRGASMVTVIGELTSYLRGWLQYFGICQVPSPRRDLDEWIRARLRLLQVKQWKRGRTAYRGLVALGVHGPAAIHTARYVRRWWYAAHSPGMHQAMQTTYFDRLGLPRLAF